MKLYEVAHALVGALYFAGPIGRSAIILEIGILSGNTSSGLRTVVNQVEESDTPIRGGLQCWMKVR
jgi:hypothetical protein